MTSFRLFLAFICNSVHIDMTGVYTNDIKETSLALHLYNNINCLFKRDKHSTTYI